MATLSQSRLTRNTPTVLEARTARAIAEAALGPAGWPWRRGLSLWIDALVVLEEANA